jgi:hypothetical protein
MRLEESLDYALEEECDPELAYGGGVRSPV